MLGDKHGQKIAELLEQQPKVWQLFNIENICGEDGIFVKLVWKS